jgi:hypothetical protein
VKPQPNKGLIRRACAAIRGILAPIAAGAIAGSSAGTHELAKTAIENLNNLSF